MTILNMICATYSASSSHSTVEWAVFWTDNLVLLTIRVSSCFYIHRYDLRTPPTSRENFEDLLC